MDWVLFSWQTWDADLATMAQSWADRCRFDHGQTSNPSAFDEVGQNIYATGGKANKPPLPAQFVSFWHAEVTDYDYNSNGCNLECGHYKQVKTDGTKVSILTGSLLAGSILTRSSLAGSVQGCLGRILQAGSVRAGSVLA